MSVTITNPLEPRSLLDVIPKKTVQALLQSFHLREKTGMVLIIDEIQVDGSRKYIPIHSSDGEAGRLANFNPYCRAFRDEGPRFRQACESCDMKHLQDVYKNVHLLAELARGAYKYRCHMQLWDAIIPVKLGGKVRGGIYAGQKLATADRDAKAANRKKMSSLKIPPPRIKELESLLENASEPSETIDLFWESFESFAETFQVTADALYNAWQLKQTEAAIDAVNQKLAAAVPAHAVAIAEEPVGDENPMRHVAELLEMLSNLADTPLWFLVRRGSRYRAEAASRRVRNTLPFQLRVANVIQLGADTWHVGKDVKPLHEELRKHIPRHADAACFFKVDSPNAVRQPLSVALLAGAKLGDTHRVTIEAALRAIAYPVHIGLLVDRLRKTHDENAKHFAFIGHHLKQPLSVVYALAWRLAHHQEFSPATVPKRLEWADELMEKCTQALEDALTLQTAVLGAPTDVDIQRLVGDLVCDQRAIAEIKKTGISIHFQSNPRLHAIVRAIAARLRISLAALVDNAVKYSWERETVTIRLEQIVRLEGWSSVPHAIVIWIENFGEGFSPKQKKLLYEVGGRITGASKRHVREGFGLGLPQAKSFIEDYGGAIDIDSEPVAAKRESTSNRYRTIVKVTLPTV